MGDARTERARELAGEISAAEANLAAVLAEVERRGIPRTWECRDMERFAGWHLQYAPGPARALAEVGRAMAELPVVAEAVADGTLSFDKAKSIVRVAAPETERALVDMALHATTAQTQRICGKWRKVDAREVRPRHRRGRRSAADVLVVTDDDGVELRIRFITSMASSCSPPSIPKPKRSATNARPPPHWTRPRPTILTVARRATRTAPSRSSPSPNGGPGPPPVGRTTSHPSNPKAPGIGVRHHRRGPCRHRHPLRPRPPRPRLEVALSLKRDQLAELEPAGVGLQRDIARWLACDAGLMTVIEAPRRQPPPRRQTQGSPVPSGHKKSRHVPLPHLRLARMRRHRRADAPHPPPLSRRPRRRRIHRPRMPRTPPTHPHPRHLDHHRPDGTTHHWRPDSTEILANPSADHGQVNALEAPAGSPTDASPSAPTPRTARQPAGTATPSTSATASKPSKPAATTPSTHPPHPQQPLPQPQLTREMGPLGGVVSARRHGRDAPAPLTDSNSP